MRIEYEQEEDGRWIAYNPETPGAMVYGDTREQAGERLSSLVLEAEMADADRDLQLVQEAHRDMGIEVTDEQAQAIVDMIRTRVREAKIKIRSVSSMENYWRDQEEVALLKQAIKEAIEKTFDSQKEGMSIYNVFVALGEMVREYAFVYRPGVDMEVQPRPPGE